MGGGVDQYWLSSGLYISTERVFFFFFFISFSFFDSTGNPIAALNLAALCMQVTSWLRTACAAVVLPLWSPKCMQHCACSSVTMEGAVPEVDDSIPRPRSQSAHGMLLFFRRKVRFPSTCVCHCFRCTCKARRGECLVLMSKTLSALVALWWSSLLPIAVCHKNQLSMQTEGFLKKIASTYDLKWN